MNQVNRLDNVDPEASTVLIGFNPKAGSSGSEQTISRLQAALTGHGLIVQRETDVQRLATESRRLHAAGALRAVVSAGGDGTAALLANSLFPEVPLAIFPLGTENLLAKHLGHTADPAAMANKIASGRAVRLDAGLANGRVFLVLASCGFDADVVHHLHGQRTGNINRLSYTWPILASIRRYRYPELRLRLEDGFECRARWAFVFNVPQYALQMPIVHDASGLDGQLDLCAFRRGSLWNGLVYALGIALRIHRRWRDTTVRRFTRLWIDSDEPVPYQLDGDPGGFLPLEISVASCRLRVVVDDKWLQSREAEWRYSSPAFA
jgi:diacylglycerol kinase family enzyme